MIFIVEVRRAGVKISYDKGYIVNDSPAPLNQERF
jgi:hypothetical protein